MPSPSRLLVISPWLTSRIATSPPYQPGPPYAALPHPLRTPHLGSPQISLHLSPHISTHFTPMSPPAAPLILPLLFIPSYMPSNLPPFRNTITICGTRADGHKLTPLFKSVPTPSIPPPHPPLALILPPLALPLPPPAPFVHSTSVMALRPSTLPVIGSGNAPIPPLRPPIYPATTVRSVSFKKPSLLLPWTTGSQLWTRLAA